MSEAQQLARTEPCAAHVEQGQREVDRESLDGDGIAVERSVDGRQRHRRYRDAGADQERGLHTEKADDGAVQPDANEHRHRGEDGGDIQPLEWRISRHFDAGTQGERGPQCRRQCQRIRGQHDELFRSATEETGAAYEACGLATNCACPTFTASLFQSLLRRVLHFRFRLNQPGGSTASPGPSGLVVSNPTSPFV
jgi:hypothetical protein